MSCSRGKLCNLLVDVLFANKQESLLFGHSLPVPENTESALGAQRRQQSRQQQLCLAALGDTLDRAPIRMSVREEGKSENEDSFDSCAPF